MKKQINILVICAIIVSISYVFSSCEKEEGEFAPEISFKTGGSYTSADATLAAGSSLTIGIDAEKSGEEEEAEDVLKHFNISRSLNGGASTSVYDVDMGSADEESFEYDFSTTVSSTVGDKEKYTFTISNRDGLTGQVSLTVTAN